MPPRTAANNIALADRSGLSVDAIGGKPGVYTANWAGTRREWRATTWVGMRRVEDALQAAGAHHPGERRGPFNATLCLAHPDGREVDL